jgi:prolyl-tRNA editing enzyme YbaK/EbsC (Cys-tRNA(Pro) deacylase)
VGEIVKSLVAVCDDTPVLALVPGDRRATWAKVRGGRRRVGRTDRALRARVTQLTGFAPGAVAPFGLSGIERVLIDRVLLARDELLGRRGRPGTWRPPDARARPFDARRARGSRRRGLATPASN